MTNMPSSTLNQDLTLLTDNLKQVITKAAEIVGKPYPYKQVQQESVARELVPGSLFKFLDGSYGWTALSGAVIKPSGQELPDMRISKYAFMM